MKKAKKMSRVYNKKIIRLVIAVVLCTEIILGTVIMSAAAPFTVVARWNEGTYNYGEKLSVELVLGGLTGAEISGTVNVKFTGFSILEVTPVTGYAFDLTASGGVLKLKITDSKNAIINEDGTSVFCLITGELTDTETKLTISANIKCGTGESNQGDTGFTVKRAPMTPIPGSTSAAAT